MEQKRCYGCMRPISEERFCPHCGYDQETKSAPHQLPAGTVLKGQYLIGRVLGQGGFGITYLGWDLYLNIPIAIKEYYPSGAVMRENAHSLSVTNCEGRTGSTFESNRRRFLREAQSLAQLSNVPEVVQVRNFFPENETAYIIMEYIQGVTLKDQLAQHGIMDAQQTLQLMRPVMEGLKKVHDVGLVHRDISPDNIMILPDGRIKLLDFGAVRDTDEKSAMRSTQAILKPGFAPIEQYKSRGELGPWTDIYALCGTIFYCMTGKVPMDAPERVLDQCGIGWEDIPGLTETQVQALNRGTELFPNTRLQSVAELMQLLYNMPAAEPAAPISATIPLYRGEKPAVQSEFVTVPLSRKEEPAVQPEFVTVPMSREEESAVQPVSMTVPLSREEEPAVQPVSVTVPLSREEKPAVQPVSVTVPLSRGEAAAAEDEETLAVTVSVDREAVPAAKPIPGIETMKTIPLDRAGMVEPISFTAPVDREEAERIAVQMSAIQDVPENPTYTMPLVPPVPEVTADIPAEQPEEEQKGKDGKKKSAGKIILAVVAAVVVLLVVGFFTIHFWEDATCTEARVCTLCGKTDGEPLGHNWNAATCTAPQTCARCKKTSGEPAGHRMEAATCTSPAVCVLCGETEGEAQGHIWRQATCTEPQTCTKCGATEGVAKGHSLRQATCTSAASCKVCGAKQGNALGHSWKAATYTTPKTCSRCGKTEGTVKGYIASVSGEWEQFSRNNSNTYALIFNSSVKGCRSLTLNYEVTFNHNSYVDQWKFYYRNSSGTWVEYQKFTLKDGDTDVTITFDPKVTITGVAVLPAKSGSFSYTFNLSVTDVYGDG